MRQKRPSPHPTSSAVAKPRPAMRAVIGASRTNRRPWSPASPCTSSQGRSRLVPTVVHLRLVLHVDRSLCRHYVLANGLVAISCGKRRWLIGLAVNLHYASRRCAPRYRGRRRARPRRRSRIAHANHMTSDRARCRRATSDLRNRNLNFRRRPTASRSPFRLRHGWLFLSMISRKASTNDPMPSPKRYPLWSSYRRRVSTCRKSSSRYLSVGARAPACVVGRIVRFERIPYRSTASMCRATGLLRTQRFAYKCVEDNRRAATEQRPLDA